MFKSCQIHSRCTPCKQYTPRGKTYSKHDPLWLYISCQNRAAPVCLAVKDQSALACPNIAWSRDFGEIEQTSQETWIGRAEQNKRGRTKRRELRSIFWFRGYWSLFYANPALDAWDCQLLVQKDSGVSASHWCTYCDTLLALWKNGGSIEGQPWTLDKLNEHLKRLELGDLNKRNVDKRKGVSSETLFDFVDIDRYVMPTLHLILGTVHYLY